MQQRLQQSGATRVELLKLCLIQSGCKFTAPLFMKVTEYAHSHKNRQTKQTTFKLATQSLLCSGREVNVAIKINN